jgi:[acyl-carrier-protein] S-malonyltransferase
MQYYKVVNMSKTIALFPGQGSQYVGMAKLVASESPAAKALLQKADDILGFALSTMMFDGPEADLKYTANTQPALFVSSMMVMELLKEKSQNFDCVAGHSLGEYSAICAAGGFSFEDGLKLVRVRGELMASAGDRQPGAMSAVMGMEESEILEQLEIASHSGVVVPANFNCPGQIVISGSVEGVAKAGELISALGKKVVPLPVSGAFHSPLMEFALEGLAKAVEATIINDLKVPLIANVTAEPIQSALEIKKLLVRQLVSPVRWSQCMNTAINMGVQTALEVGSGKVLMGLMRKISREVQVFPMESSEGLLKYMGE